MVRNPKTDGRTQKLPENGWAYPDLIILPKFGWFWTFLPKFWGFVLKFDAFWTPKTDGRTQKRMGVPKNDPEVQNTHMCIPCVRPVAVIVRPVAFFWLPIFPHCKNLILAPVWRTMLTLACFLSLYPVPSWSNYGLHPSCKGWGALTLHALAEIDT